MQDELLTPLGMSATRYGSTHDVVMGRNATTYNRSAGTLRNWIYTYAGRFPAAGLNTSAADTARFLAAFDQGRILRPETLKELWTPARLNDGKTSNYALGWSVSEHRGMRVVGHEGGGHAWIAHFPEQHLSVAVLTNLNGMRDDTIQYRVADVLLP